MGIDPIQFKKMFQAQGSQKVQKTQAVQSGEQTNQTQNSSKSSSGGSLMDKLNGMDNKLNQGGGVSLTNSAAGQSGGIEEMLKKRKF